MMRCVFVLKGKTQMMIKPRWLAGLSLAVLVVAAHAQIHTDQETKEDIARHRAMAAAHEAMAKCLEAGKPEKICLAELQAACKGLGIGKYCGMKHVH